MPFKVYMEEDGFLSQLGLSVVELEPLAENCSKVTLKQLRIIYIYTFSQKSDRRRNCFKDTELDHENIYWVKFEACRYLLLQIRSKSIPVQEKSCA